MRRIAMSFVLVVLFACVGLAATTHGALAQDDGDGVGASNPVFLPLVAPGRMSVAGGEADHPESGQGLVARIYFKSPADRDQLVADLDVFEEATTGGFVTAYISPAQRAHLAAGGYRVEVDAAKTGELHTAMQEIAAAAQTSAGLSLSTIPGYACYRTVEETYSSLSGIATSKPGLATWIDIGDSWEKVIPGGKAGYDLFALKLTNSAVPGPKPKFYLMAAIHAREYTTAELATRFAEELAAKYNVDPDVTWMLDHLEVHIVAQANPDGRKIAEGGALWRKNTDSNDGCRRSTQWGTDLNRNSSFKWNTGGSSGQPCNETYRGPSAASEPETQAIQNYALSIFPDYRGPADTDAANPATTEGVFISLHSYSELVLFPWGYTTTPAPNSTALQTLGRKFGFHNGYQVCNGPTCLYGTSGTTDDFTYGDRGVASYTFELGRNFFETCSFFTSNIVPKNMPALYYALKAAQRPYRTPAGPDVTSVGVSAGSVAQGAPVTLSATANDTRYASNGWGTEPTQAIAAARYTIDLPSWKATGTFAMTAADGAFNSGIENLTATISTAGLSVGRHTILVEAQDASGNWGVPTAVFLTVN
jgi:murein tripeptide amidase MpaA